MRLLFITWDGPQVDYLETLFLPIFAGLREKGVATAVLQFCWGKDVQPLAERCARAGVGYRAVPVWRRGGSVSALASAVHGARYVRQMAAEFKPDAIMPRSHMPAVATMVAGGSKLASICFDADGLAAEERVEFGGVRSGSAIHRSLTAVESAMLRQSAVVIVRSDYAASFLAARSGVPLDRFRMVANGRDPHLFNPGSTESRATRRAKLGIPDDAILLAYAGSMGPQYRPDLIASTALAVSQAVPKCHLLVLSGDSSNASRYLAAEDSRILGFSTVMRVAPESVPGFLAAADVGMSFRTQTMSTRAVAPVKLGEYLLCGLPVIGTKGIGDTWPAEEAGVFLDGEAGASAIARWVTEGVMPNRDHIRSKARAVGLNNFSLSRSIEDYARALGLA
jgi:glycosyltransferase involved in cell wall biosynthesis